MKLALVLVSLTLLGSGAAVAAQDKFDVTPEEHAACDADATALCASSYPDADQLLVCMKAKRVQLSPACLKVFTTGLRRRHIPL